MVLVKTTILVSPITPFMLNKVLGFRLYLGYENKEEKWLLKWTNSCKIVEKRTFYLFNITRKKSTRTIDTEDISFSVSHSENPCVPGSIPGGTTLRKP
jgi:hypothetical protein